MKQDSEADRFVTMDELRVRLGTSRVSIYRLAKKCLPGFPPLRRSGGKAGMLNSELSQYLASLPIIEVKGPTL